MNGNDHSQQYRCAKIVATLGPATSSVATILELAKAGANVFRLNFSHGEHAEHVARIKAIRLVEKELGRPLGMFADLQGPKFRLGTFSTGKIHISKGQKIRFDLNEEQGNETRVLLPHPEIISALSIGDRLLIDDGKMIMCVEQVDQTFVEASAEVDGYLSDRKGVSLPDCEINVSALTSKDRQDLSFALDHGITSFALSFVQRPEDLIELREVANKPIQLIAKIEKPSALNYLDEIIKYSDAVMVARGDLGVELPPEKVPSVQKKIVAAARNIGRPVIVATQMLETMITTPTPTRAESSDVATAVYDGVDAVMLSAETAAGDYPVEAVTMMSRIIAEVESDPLHRSLMEASRQDNEKTKTDAISAAARQVAPTIDAKAVICYSTSGKTALRAARERPEAPIVALTYDVDVARSLNLVWGVKPIVCPDATDVREMVQTALSVTEEKGIVQPGDTVVITAGVPFGNAGSTNILRIAEVGRSV